MPWRVADQRFRLGPTNHSLLSHLGTKGEWTWSLVLWRESLALAILRDDFVGGLGWWSNYILVLRSSCFSAVIGMFVLATDSEAEREREREQEREFRGVGG